MKRPLLIRGTAVVLFLLCTGLFLEGQQVVFSEDFSGFTTGTHATPSTSDVSGSLDSRTGIPGWTGSKVYSAGGEIKIGTSEVTGWIETPAVNLAQGELILKFDISRWPGDASTVQAYLNGTTIGAVITPTDAFQKVSIPVPAGTSSGKFRFMGLTKRFFLDNISVEKGSVSATDFPQQSFRKLSVYPNPASGFLRIDNEGLAGRIEIADISGKLVKVIEPSGTGIMEISLEGFSSGIYFIRLNSGSIVHTSRLIVVNPR